MLAPPFTGLLERRVSRLLSSDEAIELPLPHEKALLSSHITLFAMRPRRGYFRVSKLSAQLSQVRNAGHSHSLYASCSHLHINANQLKDHSPQKYLILATKIILGMFPATLVQFSYDWVPTEAVQHQPVNSMINCCSSSSLQSYAHANRVRCGVTSNICRSHNTAGRFGNPSIHVYDCP